MLEVLQCAAVGGFGSEHALQTFTAAVTEKQREDRHRVQIQTHVTLRDRRGKKYVLETSDGAEETQTQLSRSNAV